MLCLNQNLVPFRLFLVLLVLTASVAKAQVTPQQLEVLQSKNSQLSKALQASQQNAYTRLETAYHQQVLQFLDALPPEQQAILKRNETQWLTSIQRTRENTLDVAEQQGKDMNVLWQAAVYRSQPIRYAIEKLSRQDASGKPVKNKTGLKRLLNTTAQVGGAAASIVSGTPIGLLSGALVNDIVNQSNSSTTRPVTDADMVILARAVDDLQQELLDLYLSYKQSQAVLALQQGKLAILDQTYALTRHHAVALQGAEQGDPSEQLMRYMLKDTQQSVQRAEQSFQQAQHRLGLKVGEEALLLLEKDVD
jgi:DNA-binding GntR family transcriptional regulator